MSCPMVRSAKYVLECTREMWHQVLWVAACPGT
eukprot:CAMPEP_0197472240 /NCGR_PEP_ID=MMETSP1309-20131121/3440_1 /TAXON_ID=464262 /ORGANISM="Genus nov. species nov., Strain RCC998" /LENGTH=32 /DNA_ID= /DNA_START= /DNA_END= /DNA_ORIENTATION=